MHTAPTHPRTAEMASADVLADTVDWVTRIDASAFAHLRVLVASAGPGRGGGANGVAMVRTWLSNMGVDTAERSAA